jgi:hypothetical protein
MRDMRKLFLHEAVEANTIENAHMQHGLQKENVRGEVFGR